MQQTPPNRGSLPTFATAQQTHHPQVSSLGADADTGSAKQRVSVCDTAHVQGGMRWHCRLGPLLLTLRDHPTTTPMTTTACLALNWFLHVP
jgi:hypothetical protein